MASFNKVILLGNLTRDPELRSTPSGMSILKMGLAVNRKYKNAQGELQEEVSFIDIDAFGHQAETIHKYVSKGSPLLVEGRLRLDQWEDKEGQKRSKLGVVLETFQFVGGRSDGGQGGGDYEDSAPPRARSSSGSSSKSQAPTSRSDDDDEPPF